MAEGAALEMRCAGNRTEGSNPSRSVWQSAITSDPDRVPLLNQQCVRAGFSGSALLTQRSSRSTRSFERGAEVFDQIFGGFHAHRQPHQSFGDADVASLVGGQARVG